MGLSSPKFLITTGYGLVSMVTYVVVCLTILKNYKQFRGSFFVLFLIHSAMNMVTYFNSFITLRLPQNTCRNCTLAPYFDEGHHFALEIFHTIHYHCAYLQYSMIMTIAINRCTMIFYPFTYDKTWMKYMPFVVMAIIFLPFIATLRLSFGSSYYYYVKSFDGYAINTSVDRETIYNYLLPFSLVVTVISLIVNITSLMSLHRVPSMRKSELNLFWMGVVMFGEQAFLVFISVLNRVGASTQLGSSSFTQYALLLVPFASDGLTLLDPFLLIMFSSLLRGKLFQSQQAFTVTAVSKN